MGTGALRAALIVCFLLLWQPLHEAVAAGDERFDAQSIPFDGAILGSYDAELNGAAGRELLVFEAQPNGARQLEIFEKGLGRGFGDRPTVEMPVPNSVFAFQLVDIDGDGLDEILLLGFESTYIVEYSGSAYSANPGQIAEYERLFSVPSPETISQLAFVFDLDDDGVSELLLPCWNGVALLQRKDDKYVQRHRFEVRQRAGTARNHDFLSPGAAGLFGFRFPRVTVHDLNTDRAKDVFVQTEAGLSVFYQTGAMQFTDTPDKELPIRPSYLEGLYYSATDFGDINGDGLVDYSRVFTQGSGYDARSLVEVFFGNIHDGYSQRPSTRIVLDEFVVGLALVDLNHDGSKSLVVATQQLSTIGMVKNLMVKRIPVELKVFTSVGGLISDEPVAVKKTSCAIDLLRESFPARFVGCMLGDIDSDNRNELVIIDHDSELQVYQGEEEAVFGDKPIYSMPAHNIESLNAVDFDRDNKSDLVLSGVDEDAHPVLMILWSK